MSTLSLGRFLKPCKSVEFPDCGQVQFLLQRLLLAWPAACECKHGECGEDEKHRLPRSCLSDDYVHQKDGSDDERNRREKYH